MAGCGGGGGGGSAGGGGPSLLPSSPSGGGSQVSSPDPAATVNEGVLAASSLLGYSRQLSGSSAQSTGGAGEVYDPQTQSSVARSFVQATLAAAAVSRSKGAYLIASSTYGIATAARDLLAGIGAGSSSYTFLDTGDGSTSNRSAYLGTPENSLVNILSNPLYTRRGSELVGGLIISPDDIKKHGWILSDTGFDGNVDPVAGITGRKWLSAHSSEIASGYRQAASTGKVRLFYGLSGDGKVRHAASNGCKGFEQHCLGTPYFVRIRNGQGRYIDVEGAFVSTYGFAAYLMVWERMPEATHISEVFELGDECAHDLGEEGADADTGLGRLDVGCMAGRIYAAQTVSEPESEESPPVTVTVAEPESKEPPPVTVTVAEPESEESPPVTVTVAEPESEESPPVTVTVAEPESEESPPVTVTVAEPESKEPPPVTVTVAEPESEESPPVTVTVAEPESEESPPVTVTVAEPESKEPSPVTVTLDVMLPVTLTILAGQDLKTVTLFKATVTVEVKSPAMVTVSTPEQQVVATVSLDRIYWHELKTWESHFVSLGVTVATDRIQNAYVIGYTYHDKTYSSEPEKRKRWGRRRYEGSRAESAFEVIQEMLGRGTSYNPPTDYTMLSDYSHISSLYEPHRKYEIDYQDAYDITQENSIVHFARDPFYLYGSNARTVFLSGSDENVAQVAKDIAIDPETINSHGWIVSGAAYDFRVTPTTERFLGHRDWLQGEYRKHMEEGYRQALATGKVRLFYFLDVDEEGRVRDFQNNWGSNGCKGFEHYCIGVPNNRIQVHHNPFITGIGLEGGFHPYNVIHLEAAYGFGLYLLAWQRMPAEAHISAVFAMGDRCTVDIGEEGPDAATGLGFLDVGCIAREVYQANLDPSTATLSVAVSQMAAQVQPAASIGQMQAQSSEGQGNDPARQLFLDDFAQELFSDLGSLSLPGGSEASLEVGFAGDSFQGRYRPTRGVQPHYRVSPPRPGYALLGGNLGVMGIGAGEVGIFARIKDVDVSFSYFRSENFFGGTGSGQFGFDRVGNARLMLQRRLLSEDGEHSLLLGGWLRHAKVAGGRGGLLDGLHGSEYGASMRYGWQPASGDWGIAATAWTARFAGGEVEVAGDSFGISSSDWKWGLGLTGTYEF